MAPHGPPSRLDPDDPADAVGVLERRVVQRGRITCHPPVRTGSRADSETSHRGLGGRVVGGAGARTDFGKFVSRAPELRRKTIQKRPPGGARQPARAAAGRIWIAGRRGRIAGRRGAPPRLGAPLQPAAPTPPPPPPPPHTAERVCRRGGAPGRKTMGPATARVGSAKRFHLGPPSRGVQTPLDRRGNFSGATCDRRGRPKGPNGWTGSPCRHPRSIEHTPPWTDGPGGPGPDRRNFVSNVRTINRKRNSKAYRQR
ncbi:uncharacterized protein PS065_008635 [Dugong dugon]